MNGLVRGDREIRRVGNGLAAAIVEERSYWDEERDLVKRASRDRAALSQLYRRYYEMSRPMSTVAWATSMQRRTLWPRCFSRLCNP